MTQNSRNNLALSFSLSSQMVSTAKKLSFAEFKQLIDDESVTGPLYLKHSMLLLKEMYIDSSNRNIDGVAESFEIEADSPEFQSAMLTAIELMIWLNEKKWLYQLICTEA